MRLTEKNDSAIFHASNVNSIESDNIVGKQGTEVSLKVNQSPVEIQTGHEE